MFVVRSVFKCKPGKANALIDKFKASTQLMKDSGSVLNERLLVDEVADFWTVVIETEVEDLASHAEVMQIYRSRDDVQAAMAGYMDLVESGYREVFRIV